MSPQMYLESTAVSLIGEYVHARFNESASCMNAEGFLLVFLSFFVFLFLSFGILAPLLLPIPCGLAVKCRRDELRNFVRLWIVQRLFT